MNQVRLAPSLHTTELVLLKNNSNLLFFVFAGQSVSKCCFIH